MTPEQKKEEVSKAYLRAVAAECGYAVGSWSQDQGCVDTTIAAAGILGGGDIADPKLDVQLKASAREEVEHEQHFALSLKTAHYNKLRVERRSSPIILVLLLLPRDEDDWVTHTDEGLTLRRCACWVSLRGEPECDTESRTVHISKANKFCPDQLNQLMEKISRGDSI